MDTRQLARIAFYICAVLTGVVWLLGASIAAAYAPEGLGAGWLVGAAFVGLLLVLWILVARTSRGRGVPMAKRVFLGLSGVAFAGFGGYRAVVDSGDIVLWIWPLLMGLALIVIALGQGASA